MLVAINIRFQRARRAQYGHGEPVGMTMSASWQKSSENDYTYKLAGTLSHHNGQRRWYKQQ